MAEGGSKRGRRAVRTRDEAAREYVRVHGHSALRDAFYGLCCASRWELQARAAWWAIDARRRSAGKRPPAARRRLPDWCVRFVDRYGAFGEQIFPVEPGDPARFEHPIAQHAVSHSRGDSPTIPRPPAAIVGAWPNDFVAHHRQEARKAVVERLLFEGTAIIAEPGHHPYDTERPRIDYGSRMALIGAALDIEPIGRERLTVSTRWRKRISRWHEAFRCGDSPMVRAPMLEASHVEHLHRRLDEVVPADAML